MKIRFHVVFLFMLCALLPPTAQRVAAASLRVGAAKVDITPPASGLPERYEGVLDRLFARAIVIDDGARAAALITLDTGVIPDSLWQEVSSRVSLELSIPPERILLTASHTHSVPMRASPSVGDKVLEAVKLAKSRLQDARMGSGQGVSSINVNRNIIDPKTRRWWEGPNYDGASDKTVAVVAFEAVSGGLIAVYYNYAMHAVISGVLDMVSADVPGAASSYIEESLGDEVVALWSTGAAGDQNPVYFQQTYDLREIRIREYAKRGEDISNSMPPGGEGLDRNDPAVARLMNQQKQMLLSMGQVLGEEVLRVVRGMERTESNPSIWGGYKVVRCPGRERTNSGRAGYEGRYKDGPPVDIRLGLLRVGDVAIGAVNGEVFNLIAQRLKAESPLAMTMMATLTNGMARSGYIPNDAAYGMYVFEVLSSRLKPGCAESSIVDGILDLIGESRTID